MKRKITLTIDSDVYDELIELPRKVSVSETVNWILKMMLEELKAGRSLSKEELRAYLARTPEGKDFLERGDENIAPKIHRIEEELDKLKAALGISKKGESTREK